MAKPPPATTANYVGFYLALTLAALAALGFCTSQGNLQVPGNPRPSASVSQP